ncbi:MAG TPA: glycosyltransferase family 2 protein [Anaerolineae bacterium]|nr:glycosyltransferase family 2 protein [Anaerolineae bacterium]
MTEDQRELSVVIPVYNEETNIEPLYRGLKEVLEGLGLSYEIVVVDDGSTDGSFEVLRELHRGDQALKVIRLRRNFGQAAAFAAGFDRAVGETVVSMDADLQFDPADIRTLLDKIAEGYDIVSGWRVDRQEALLTRRLPSMAANWLISRITGVRLHDYGCSLKAYRLEVIRNVRLYGELHRFIPALASSIGVRLAEVPVSHYPRRHGKSKYDLSRTLTVILDLLTVKFLLSYATRPMQVFGLLGIFSFAVGTVIAAYLAFIRLFLGSPIANRPLLLLSILLIFVGVQLVTMGLLGELTIRTYHEAQGKKIYVIREMLE